MAHLHRSVATLRVMGDTLIPDEITALLGAQPSEAQTKGDQLVGPKTGRVRIAKFGMWRLHASERQPEDLDSQVQELLGQLTTDLSVWADLARRFDLELFCGLFMEVENEGVLLSPRTLVALGERGIELDLDIYAP